MSDLRIDDSLVEVPGGRVFVRAWVPETAAAIPIILLHDSLGCVGMWRDFPAALARRVGAPVIAYDRLGFGRSTACDALPAADFIREEGAAVLPALLRAMAITEFVLFGHSVGGAMALTAAAAEPRCRAVISEAAQAFVEDRTLAGIRAAQERFRDPEARARLARWHGDNADWVLRAWIETWLSPAFAGWSLDADLPRVRCPVLVIHGEDDEYGSLAFPRRIVSGVGGPAEAMILPGCGHVPHRERRDEVIARVGEFLRPGRD